MKVALTGASGLIGTALHAHLSARGDEVVPISRSREASPCWSVEHGLRPADGLSGFDAVVHLAGENLADKRWTQSQKRKIWDSRVSGTRAIVTALAAADPRPRVFVSASAVGIYGDRGNEWLEESSAPGAGFLAELCEAWELEARAAESLGMRVIICRSGLVLSTRGGPLHKMLPIFRAGVGGRLGGGRQYFPWIHERDLVRAIAFALDDERLHGAINVAAPAPVTNAEFTRTLGRVLHRPTILRVPAFGLRLAFGELASALLEGQRVEPARLRAFDFEFEFTDVRGALEDLL